MAHTLQVEKNVNHRDFKLEDLEKNCRPWTKGDIPKASLIAVFHSISRYRLEPVYQLSLNLYAIVVLKTLEVD